MGRASVGVVIRRVAVALVLSLAPVRAAAQDLITSIRQVRNLSPEEAGKGLPAKLRGIVTRSTRWETYLQNGTDAIFATPAAIHEPYQVGDDVELTGKTAPGEFLPILVEESSRLLGHGPLPAPVLATYDDLAAGRLDCRYVELTGVIRVAENNGLDEVICRLTLGGTLLRVDVADSPQLPPHLLGAMVRLRGVAAGNKNRNRQIIQPSVRVQPTPESLEILSSPPADIFSVKAVSIAKLMSASEIGNTVSLVKVTGQVSWAESGKHIYIRDATDSIEVSLQALTHAQTGDYVEAVGFSERGVIKPRLSDAVIRVIRHGGSPAPRKTTAAALLSCGNDSNLVEIEATVEQSSRTAEAVVLTLTDEAVTFLALYAQGKDRASAVPPVGARIKIAGICEVLEANHNNLLLMSATSFRLRVRGPDDIRVLWSPPFNPMRTLMIAVGGLSVALLLASIWIWGLRRTVARQTRVIVSKTRADATMEERDRIARKLHDSLEQHLSGATILLDATACAWERRQEVARTHLDTARAMLRHSLNDAQRAVLNLRSRELQGGDLAGAFEQSLRLMVAPADVKLLLEVRGKTPRLDGVSENHVLRVAQEAVANALKHANPVQIRVCLAIDDGQLALTVEDDGRGFEAESSLPSESACKFGLLGMRERAEKLHGKVSIQSAPGRGTRVELAIPLDRNVAGQKG